MIFLALSVACSLAIGMIFKHAARQGIDRMALLTINYGVAALLAGALLIGAETGEVLAMPPALVVLGLATGTLFIGGFFLLSYATEVAGMSLALGVMRLSVVIPVLASWVLWREVPTVAQQVGLLLACGAFVLMAGSRSPGEVHSGSAFPVLGVLFLVGGLVDVLLKAFDEGFGGRNGTAGYLLLAFTTACVLGAGRVVQQGRAGNGWPGRSVARWGIALGLVNYGSAALLLEAVARLRGPVVFPLNNIGIVLGGAALGALVWGEPLSRRTRIGLAAAAVALVLIGRAG